jgi:hypothetical protein
MAAKEVLLFSSSNSRDTSLYPSGNSYTLYLSSPVKNIERIDLVNARVPNTIYNLTNGTDVLSLGPSGSPTTVSLNPGFYGVYDMATALTNTGLVTVTYLTFEGKFIFSSASPFGVQINSVQLSNILGIPVTTTAIAATLVPGSGSTWPTYAGQYILVSQKIVNTSIGEIIFLDIDELKTPRHVFTGGLKYDTRQSYVTQLTDGSGPSRAFAPISLDVGSGCMKNFNEGNDYKISVFYPEPINSLQRLTIRWVDINGQPLIFNGLENNSFILRLHVRAKVMEPTEEENDLERRVEELEIKRMVADAEAMEAAAAAKRTETKKTRFGKWTVVLLALLGILGYVVYKRFLRPNPVGEFGPVI